MRVSVEFQQRSLELEIPDENLVGAWHGPAGSTLSAAAEIVRTALEAPLDFPPLRQTIVPGDRVTIAFDPLVPEPGPVLEPIFDILRQAGVEAGDLTVLLPSGSNEQQVLNLPEGAAVAVHDPSDRSQLAYLAATKEGRRIYLNRRLTDADMVLPVGRLGFDPILGYHGPFSVLFPGMSDDATLTEHRSLLRADSGGAAENWTRSRREESLEVSWLLGTQLHVGVLPGASGIALVVAGKESVVCEQGIAWLDERWTFRPESRAEIVVAGIGGPADVATPESLAQGLATARRLVQHGGKIVVLTNGAVVVGPALRGLIDAGGAERGLKVLRGHERDFDFQLASRIAEAVSWADVFLFSSTDRELVEDLSMASLEKVEQVGRLVAQCRSATIVSLAESTRALVQEDEAP